MKRPTPQQLPPPHIVAACDPLDWAPEPGPWQFCVIHHRRFPTGQSCPRDEVEPVELEKAS